MSTTLALGAPARLAVWTMLPCVALAVATLAGATLAASAAGAQSASSPAAARTVARTPGAPASPAPRRLEVTVDGHPLTVWAKSPPAGTRVRGSLLLVHGRRWSALPNFDLRVPGDRRSVMDALAARGYAVHALDLRGYGGTPRDSSGWLSPSRAAADVAATLHWLRDRAPRGTPAPVLVGYSRGAAVAMLAAQRDPQAMSALVLFGFPIDPDTASRIGAGAPDPAAPPRARNTAEQAASDFLAPGAQPRAVVDAYVRAALAADSVTADWRAMGEFSALDPARVSVPTLVLDGARDPYANAAARAALVPRLGTVDRWWIVLPGGDHAAHVEDTQRAWVDAVVRFVERPPAGSGAR